MVISSCQDLQIAHNVFAGRSKSSGYVRVVIWPRCSVYEVKNLFTADSEAGYYVAVAELAGMVVASENYAGTLSYDKVESLLYNERLPRSIFHTLECKLHETLSTE